MKPLGNIVLLFGITTTVLLAEPSVYGNNNREYNSSNNVASQNKRTISFLKRTIAEQNERIDGLMSVVEGLSVTVYELQQQGSSRSSSRIDSNSNNTQLLKELGIMIDKINEDYVSKAELQNALKSEGKYNSSGGAKATKIEVKKPQGSLKNKSTSKLYTEGVRLFSKKRYDESKKRFIITDSKGYKPAASNYYLGEISYYTKKYEDAIFYFKKSAGLYDQASYIDTLLLHTAISLEKSGEKAQAKTFYQNIINNYEGRNSAKIAKKKLKQL